MISAPQSNERFGVAVGQSRSSEMSVSLTFGSATLHDDGVLSEWGFHGKLLECDDRSSCFDDPGRY